MFLATPRRVPCTALICRILCWSGLLLHCAALNAQQIVTIGSQSRSVERVASTLTSLGNASLENGQLIKGQQQLLLAATLHATSSRLLEVYSGSLNRPIDGLEQSQLAPLNHLAGLLNDLGNLAENTDAQTAQLILKALDVAHEVFDHVPAADKPPTIFGAAIPGVLTPTYSDALVIFGYHLKEPRSGDRNPDVTIGNTTIRGEALDADFSKVVIHLTPSLRRSMGLGYTSCDPMRSSTISLHTYSASGFLANLLHTTDDTLATPLAAPPPQFEFLIEELGTSKVRTAQSFPFSIASPYVSVGCDDAATTTVAWQAPENAEVSGVNAQWRDLNNVRSQTQSVIPSGRNYLATGSIAGVGKQCFLGICNCPGGGHGVLVLSGTYQVPDSGTRTFSTRQPARGSELVQVKVPSQDTWTLDRLVIRVTRKDCETELDRLEVAASDLVPGRDLPSAKGIFHAQLAAGVIVIRIVNPMQP